MVKEQKEVSSCSLVLFCNRQYLVKTESGHVYECLIDGYPISSVNSQIHAEHSSPISLSTEHRQQQDHSYYLSLSAQGQEERVNQQWLPEKRLRHEAPSPITVYQTRILPSGTPDLISSRSIRSLRSNSLPITSETPRYQVLRRSHTPDDRHVILSEGQHGHHFIETPSERVSQRSLERSCTPVTQHSPVLSKTNTPFSGSSQRAQSPLERSETSSREDIYHMASSHEASRSLMRPHTPIGRIDILPSQQVSPVTGSSYLQLPRLTTGSHSLSANVTVLPIEERPGEYYVATTSARARGQTLNRPHSRPQTPSNRLDVLPSEEHYTFLSSISHGTFRSQQRSPGPFERLTLIPLEERDIEGLSATLPSRPYGTSPRLHYRPHTPVERVTVLPCKDRHTEMSVGRHRAPGIRPLTYQSRSFPPPPSYISRMGSTLRLSGKMGSSSSIAQLPPRPPTSPRPSPSPLLPTVRRLSIAPSMCGREMYQEITAEPVRMAESEVDVLLTRLCGQDRVLQGLVVETSQLKAQKDKLEGVLEVTRCQMLNFGGQQNIVEQLAYQQRILQEDLIQIRAKLCDLSMEMERSWNEYEFLEKELQRLRAPRELVSRCGSPQERGEAQRDLWMMEDVMLGLSNNKKSFQVAIGSTRHPVMPFATSPVLDHHSALQRDSLQTPIESSPLPSPTSRQSTPHSEPPQAADNAPRRPPLPHLLYQAERSTSEHAETETPSPTAQSEEKHQLGEKKGDLPYDPVTNGTYKGQHTLIVGGINRKGKMSAEEQLERMKRHQEAQLKEKPRTATLTQRSVAVSPIMRAASTEQATGTPRLRSGTLLTNRPLTSCSAGAHLTASVVASQTRAANTTTVTTRPTAAPETPITQHVTASNKLVTMISAPPGRTESQSRENIRVVRKECKPSKVIITTRYLDVDPNTPLSPEQLQEKQRTLEKIKTMIAKTSPSVAGSWAPSDQAMHRGERERDRIINLSYALATEASHRSKVMAAKALAELQEQGEVTDSQSARDSAQSDNTESQSKLQKNVLIFNLGPHKATANPNSGYHQETANPGSAQNNQRERTNRSPKENSPTNPSSTLEVEPANLKLGEHKKSPNLDSPQDGGRVNASLTGRALSNISLIVVEDYSDLRLAQEELVEEGLRNEAVARLCLR
uniref:pleckstrin homology domain-containing family A member 7-like n=1 Tax=Pristiophorus japonicus TaxID=55135 RepID=UPI00398EE6C7